LRTGFSLYRGQRGVFRWHVLHDGGAIQVGKRTGIALKEGGDIVRRRLDQLRLVAQSQLSASRRVALLIEQAMDEQDNTNVALTISPILPHTFGMKIGELLLPRSQRVGLELSQLGDLSNTVVKLGPKGSLHGAVSINRFTLLTEVGNSRRLDRIPSTIGTTATPMNSEWCPLETEFEPQSILYIPAICVFH
jgi:hypothetical protein